LDLSEKYSALLAKYARDMDGVKKAYQKYKADPPVARNTPPIAGKWVL